MKKKTTYESALKEIQSIINELQEEAVSIDDLSQKVKRAAELIQHCKEKLRTTETQIKETLS